MDPFRKTLLPGRIEGDELADGSRAEVPVYVQVDWDGKRLAFSGVEGPKRNGDCWGSCGQIDMSYRTDHDRQRIHPARGWDAWSVARLFDVWGRWHLNDMRAGSPRQEAWLRTHPIDVVYPVSHFDVACERLAGAGLHPDEEYQTPIRSDQTGKVETEGYRYGAAWLHEDVPEEILTEIVGWPDGHGLPTRWARQP